MNLNQIVGQLRSERARIDSAIRALDGSTNSTQPTRRKLSAAARAKIAAAQRKRWAKVKAGKK